MIAITKKVGHGVILLISIAAVVTMSLMEPIAQDTAYHQFSDGRTVFAIPNFWNVVSNLPFLIVGMMGLYSLFHVGRMQTITDIRAAYILFFVGVALVNFGSGYYHLWPSNDTLVWDRLPMTLAFMALFAVIIAEHSSVKAGRYLLWPLIVVGGFSVYYWQYTETVGHGDLRLYALVQFLPMLLIPILLLLFKPRFTHTSGYWVLLLAYLLAKVLEHYDEAVFISLGFISGHALKHIVAALGVLAILQTYKNRKRLG